MNLGSNTRSSTKSTSNVEWVYGHNAVDYRGGGKSEHAISTSPEEARTATTLQSSFYRRICGHNVYEFNLHDKVYSSLFIKVTLYITTFLNKDRKF